MIDPLLVVLPLLEADKRYGGVVYLSCLLMFPSLHLASICFTISFLSYSKLSPFNQLIENQLVQYPMYTALLTVKDLDLTVICDTFSYDDDDMMLIVKLNNRVTVSVFYVL